MLNWDDPVAKFKGAKETPSAKAMMASEALATVERAEERVANSVIQTPTVSLPGQTPSARSQSASRTRTNASCWRHP